MGVGPKRIKSRTLSVVSEEELNSNAEERSRQIKAEIKNSKIPKPKSRQTFAAPREIKRNLDKVAPIHHVRANFKPRTSLPQALHKLNPR